ncbi:DUF4878 domain-containing protein [Anaerovorax odorimutans]|uniref:DUF4878 domain-containing protein n=1 Tax=Anaerovorax odorimutans TaxID=109327 RepID=A0ABT1RSS9_9FIRM|nr:DUF4878 domain-containing protein [Anaerovorax odorimutans]MCQ4638264.1 DUF4878 domain-containing protein [Anaerovorax odorimutans]
MKKIIGIILSMVLVLGLCACGSPSPTDVTKDFMEAVKSQNAETLKTVYPDGEIDLLKEAQKKESTDAEKADDALQKIYNEEMKDKLFDFDYEVSNEKIDGDKATVDVAITTYDLGSAFTDFATEFLKQAFSMALSGSSEKEINDKAAEILSAELSKMKKDYTGTATLSLSQKDGQWVMDKIDENNNFYNIITGGMGEAAKKIENSFGGSEDQ